MKIKAAVATAIQNTFGRLVQGCNLGRTDEAAACFSSESDVRFYMPDRGIDVSGLPAIREALERQFAGNSMTRPGREWHVPCDPVYTMAEDGVTALGTWDTYAFATQPSEATSTGWENQFFFTRADGRFVWEDGQWKLSELAWYEYSSMEPWEYDPAQDGALRQNLCDLPATPSFSGNADPADYYAIQRLQARFTHDRRRRAMELFADRPDVSFRMENLFAGTRVGRESIAAELAALDLLEEQNANMYLSVPMLGGPVIEVDESGTSASGAWMVMTYDVKGPAFGGPPYHIVRRIGRLSQRFVKENGKWKLLQFDLAILMSQTPIPYCQEELRFARMVLPDNNWQYSFGELGGTDTHPDDVAEIEAMLPIWLNYMRRGDQLAYIQKYMLNDEKEIYFRSTMGGREAPPTVGWESWASKFSGPAFVYYHRQGYCHSVTTPLVEVSADGRHATALWIDHNWSPYYQLRPGHVEPGHIPLFVFISHYLHHFIKVDGEWKHYTLFWDPLLNMPDWYEQVWDSRGWAGTETDYQYPALWQAYRYCPVRSRDLPIEARKPIVWNGDPKDEGASCANPK